MNQQPQPYTDKLAIRSITLERHSVEITLSSLNPPGPAGAGPKSDLRIRFHQNHPLAELINISDIRRTRLRMTLDHDPE